MNRRPFLIGSLFGFIYSLIGYGGFFAWNYYEISSASLDKANLEGFVPGIFISLLGLLTQLIFIPGSCTFQLFENIGFPVFATFSIPFPYKNSIPVLGVFFGFIILILLSGLIGLLMSLLFGVFFKRKKAI